MTNIKILETYREASWRNYDVMKIIPPHSSESPSIWMKPESHSLSLILQNICELSYTLNPASRIPLIIEFEDKNEFLFHHNKNS